MRNDLTSNVAMILKDKICKGEINLAVDPLKVISILKHRIAHLFLPLDIDLQGVREVLQSNGDAVEYFKEVLESKKQKGTEEPDIQYYRTKLADLQYMVAGVDPSKQHEKVLVEESDCVRSFKKGVFVPPSLSAKQRGDTIERVLGDKKGSDPVEKWWELLLELSGLSTTDPLETKFGSSIFQFMCLMDRKIKEKSYDFEEALNFFETHKFFGDNYEREITVKSSEGRDEKQEICIKSFHDWFCALDNAIDRLRKSL